MINPNPHKQQYLEIFKAELDKIELQKTRILMVDSLAELSEAIEYSVREVDDLVLNNYLSSIENKLKCLQVLIDRREIMRR